MRNWLVPRYIFETPNGVLEVMTETQIVGAEMERVNPKVPTLFDRDEVFYAEIDKSTDAETVSNRAMRVPLEMRPGGRFGHYNPDNADMGVGDGPTFDKGTLSVAHLKFAVQWSKLTEMATDDKRKSVVNAFQKLLADAMPEFRRNVDSLCMQNGNGVLGTISAVSTTTNTNDTYALGTDGFGARLMRFGQMLNVYDTTLATQRTASGEVQITGYDLVGKSIVVSGTVGSVTATDKVVVSGLSGASPVSILGVPYHNTNSSSGTWLGFTRSTTPEIRANRVSASGALALPFPRLAINKIGDRVGIKARNKRMVAWMHPCQKQAYEGLGQLIQSIRREGGKKEAGLDLYFGDDMQMAGAPVREHYSWDKTRIDFLAMDLWGRAEMKPAGFYEVGGRKFFELRGASGGVQTSQIFYLTVSFNLYAKNPAALAYIDGLTVPSGY